MKITLTGIDEKTNFTKLTDILTDDIEIGILLSESPEGRHRYPLIDFIADAVHILGTFSAVHVCGRTARKRFMDNGYFNIFDQVGRIQLNGPVTIEEIDALTARYSDKTIITQAAFTPLECLNSHHKNHAILVDGSGGRGILPKEWTRPNTSKAVGFAGGLGPDNLTTEIPKIITASNGNDLWVDMESSLRDRDDWFSIDIAKQVIETINGLTK